MDIPSGIGPVVAYVTGFNTKLVTVACLGKKNQTKKTANISQELKPAVITAES